MFCQQHRGRTFCAFSSRFSDTPYCNNRLSNSWYTSSVSLVQYRTLNIAISTLLSRNRVDVATCLVSDIPWSSNTPLCIARTPLSTDCLTPPAVVGFVHDLCCFMCCLWNIRKIIRLPRCGECLQRYSGMQTNLYFLPAMVILCIVLLASFPQDEYAIGRLKLPRTS